MTTAGFALAVALLLYMPELRAQSSSEVWQVILSLPTIPDSGLPTRTLTTSLNYPYGITTDSAGNILIADSFNNLVRRFDSNGNETLTIGDTGGGSQPDRFYDPQDVAVDAAGQIIVSDAYNSRISVFDTNGNPRFQVTTYANPTTGEDESFGWPWGIAMTPGFTASAPGTTCASNDAGRIAIVNALVDNDWPGGGDVAVFNSCFSPVMMLGMATDTAPSDSILSAPIAVAIDPTTGDYLVTDTGSDPRVVVYDPTGQYLFSFGSGALSGPDDITIDSTGRVVVADADAQLVDFYTVDYADYTASLDLSISQTNTPGAFLYPHGLAFTSGGELLVTTGTFHEVATNDYEPDPTTQYVLEFDRPSLAIQSVSVSSGGSPVTTAVPAGTTLDFTVTLGTAAGQVQSVATTGTITQTDGTTLSLTPISALTNTTIAAGSSATVTYEYTVPATITSDSTVSFTAGATGVIDNGVLNDVTAPPYAPKVVSVVAPGGDTTPPTITLTPTPAAPGSSGWYTQNVALTLTATDNADGSGVKEIDYWFTGAQQGVDPTQPHRIAGATATTQVSQDKSSTIWYYAVDNAGNASTVQSQTFQVDQTAPYVIFNTPTPAWSPLSPASTRWWNSASVSVPFAAQDGESGVNTISPGSPLVFTAEGANQTTRVTVTDKAGNSSSSVTNQGPYTSPVVNIDRTPPVLGTVTATPAPNASGWNNTTVQVTFTASDNLSGFVTADSATGAIGWLQGRRIVNVSQEGRNLSPPAQTFTDLAGNVSAAATDSTPINIDVTPPVITSTSFRSTSDLATVLTPNVNGWFNRLVTVQISTTDNLSGFAGADAVDGQAGSTQGLKLLALDEGRHDASSFTISDLAGNTSNPASIAAANIDVTPPAVAAPAFVDRATGIAVSPRNGWYRGQIDVAFTATDALSGFSGGATDTRSIALATDQANQAIAVPVFTDLAGNASSGYAGNPTATTVTASVDSTPPQVTATPSSTPAWTDSDVTPNRLWYGAPVSVTFTATDLLSGFGGGTTTTSTTLAVPEGLDETVAQAFTDQAGNAATGTFGPVSVDLTRPVVTSTITADGTGETISFAASDSGSGLASCTVSVDGVIVEPTCDPITMTPSDSGKVVIATATDHVGNTATSTTTVSFAPPEAYNQFDPVSHDVLVYGFDPTTGASLGAIAPTTITRHDASGTFCQDRDGRWFGPFPNTWWSQFDSGHGWSLRVYRISGSPGNALTLVEAVQTSGHEIHVQVIGFQYTVDGATEPFIFAADATKDFEWSLNSDGSLKELNQDMSIGHGRNGVEVQAKYSSGAGNTSVHVKVDGPDSVVMLPGVALLRMATNHAAGNLVISADGLPPVPGPAGSTVPYSGGYTWGGSHDGSSGSGGDHDGDHDGDHHDADHDGHHDDGHGDHDGDHSANHAPVLAIANQSSHEGDVIALQITGTDPDGDGLTYTAAGLPPGLAMSAAGLIGGTLSYTTAGTYQVTVTATDAKGAHTAATFAWAIANVDRAPTIAAVADQTNNEGDVVSLQLAAQDPDGDTMTYAASGMPWALVINSTTGLISGTLSDSSAGTSTVTVTVTDPGGQSTATKFTWTVKHVDQTPSPAGAAQVRHAPTLNGSSIIAGSLQMMSAENVVLNGSATIIGNLFAPGLPTVQMNGTPASFGGTEDASGASAPAGYVITLNGGTALGHLIRRENPVALPVVATPPAAAGTRNVSLNNANDSAGDFATVRSLTLNGNVGAVAVPPGNYGAFTANGNDSFVLGVAGSNTPAVYAFDSLTLNGQSGVTIAGPVVITLRNGQSLSGSIGNTAHPEWTVLAIASGGLELKSGVTVAGTVIAPSGTVTIDGGSQLLGALIADRLTLNGSARLTLLGQ